MIRPARALLSTLNDILAAAYVQGDAGDDLLVHRLQTKLRALRAGARQMTIAAGAVLAGCVAALAGASFVGLARWQQGIVAGLCSALLLAAAVGALQAQRVATQIETLEDLLLAGDAMTRLDVVMAFRDRVRSDLAGEPEWGPLVDVLSSAYDTAPDARAVLEDAGVPVGHVRMEQAGVHLWRDALRVAHRCGRLDALVRRALADDSITRHHDAISQHSERVLPRCGAATSRRGAHPDRA